MQKLLTIYLNSHHKNTTHQHGAVEEYIQEYLEDGWKVVKVDSFGSHNQGAGMSSSVGATGYIIVVIEK